MVWKKKLIRFCLQKKALKFGRFTLKSGRISPYFFNSGLLSNGKDIIKIGVFYAHFIISSKIKFDGIFGPSYKGIPIVVATSIALKEHYNLNIPYFFNRKETKKYGEKGDLIGRKIRNKKIIILDDVITSGASICNSIKIVENEDAEVNSIFVLLDRREDNKINKSNNNDFKNKKNRKIISIVTTQDFISYLKEDKKLKKHIPELEEYYRQYGTD